MKNKLLVSLVVLTFVFVSSFSNQGMDIESYTNEIINKYWDAQDLLHEYKSEPVRGEKEYLKAYTELGNMLEKLTDHISAEIKKGNNDILVEFSDIYKEMPEVVKPIFNNVVSELLVSTRNGENLFPGYGYAEPGYYYRLGAETKKEVLQKFWKSEERYMESNKRYKFYIELKVATQMQQNGEVSGLIEGFNVKGVVGMTINGEFKEVAETEFTTKQTLTTKCVIAYEKNKVYYELYRAKKGFWDWLPWTDLTWEKAGETYKIHEEATDTEIIINPPAVYGLPTNPPR